METFRDFPFDKICKEAEQLISRSPGITLYQKFTCAGCGARLTMDKPNAFFEQGTCDNCPTITDIKKQGCNYLAHLVLGIDASKQGERRDGEQSADQDRDRDQP